MDSKVENDKTAEKALKAAEKAEKPAKKSGGKASKAGLAVFIVGIFALITGVVLLVLNLTAKPAVRDADYLVGVNEWTLEDQPGVIWRFTEIGKGKLTTNNHKNDYDFIWAMEGEQLKIETSWLYALNNEYTYRLDQEKGILNLTTGEGENLVSINFYAASSIDAEVPEDN